ncbi:MAG: DUF354 domain-containing protein [Candidatus Bathyarchaeota archaeon]|nr:DUF354 domain-containing protein [Candidatus Bathyarchaeota archaeon]
MKVWVDILTPKQVLFMGELSRRLEAKAHTVLRTTRKYREVNELLELKGINATVVGKHGGASLKGKLTASSQRIAELASLVEKFKPDLSIGFASPEAARTAFGLGVSHYTINDSPHSEAVALLTIPLSKKLFSPKIIPLEAWSKLGAGPEKIVQYDALDPIVWLREFHPNSGILEELGLDNTIPIVVIRAEEAFASYLLGRVPEEGSVVIPIINSLIKRLREQVQIVFLPRYQEQVKIVKKEFHKRVIVPEKVIDGSNLLHFSSVFIGCGGTMTAEAALMGIPTITCYPGESTFVDKYLVRNRLSYRLTDPEDVTKKTVQILENAEEYRKKFQKRAKALTSKMEDPLEVIMETIEKVDSA